MKYYILDIYKLKTHKKVMSIPFTVDSTEEINAAAAQIMSEVCGKKIDKYSRAISPISIGNYCRLFRR